MEDRNDRRIGQEHRIYANEKLMSDYNDMQIRIKVHLFFGDEEFLRMHPKPTVQELNDMSNRVMDALMRDSEAAVKY